MENKLYPHVFQIAFSLDSKHTPDKVTPDEIMRALHKRIEDLKNRPDEIAEAVGLPYDTYENPILNSIKLILEE